MDPVTISVEDAKRTLGIGMTKLYELMNNGTLQTVRIGRRRLVKTDSIRALVAEAA